MIKSTTAPGDTELVQLARQGKPEALTLLYERYLPMVYNRVRYTVPPEDVEDVTQEVFIAAIRSIKGFRGEAKFSTWLRSLTVRQIAEYYRKRRKLGVELNENMHAAIDLSSSDDAIILRQAFQKLPENYKEIILFRFAEGLPFQEIANMQGCNIEAVKSLFRRAVAALQKQVTSHE